MRTSHPAAGLAALLLLTGSACTDHVAGNPNPDAKADGGGGGDAGNVDQPGEVGEETAADTGGADAKPDAKDASDDRGGTDAPVDTVVSDTAPSICYPPKGLDCPMGMFCDYVCDAVEPMPGSCMTPPTGCTKEYAPVCGCDDMTYPNDCMRQAAGVGIRAKGACGAADGGSSDTLGKTCGGIAGLPCSDGEVCDYTPGECKTADVGGTCVPAPEACLDIYDPVCGCDGKTYSNDCYRIMASAQKDHDGACM